MKVLITIVAVMSALAGCAGRGGGASQASAPKVVRYGYKVVAEHPHLATSYTQGLQYADGTMWEGTGLHGESRLQTIDLATGGAEVVAVLPESEFGEGITLLGDRIYQLTWTNNVAHIYDRATGRKVADKRYSGEGWGLTTDGTKLYMSNGTDRLHILDPATFERKGSVSVTFEGRPLPYLNELEWIEGRIWANIYTTDSIAIIDPATGIVEGIVDLAGLLPESERTPDTDVLNGIAYDAEGGRIFVTGKNWSKIYEIEIFEE